MHLTSSTPSEHRKALLSVQPMMEEDGVDNFTAEGHKTCVSTVLKQCDIEEKDSIALAGDNCSTNQSLGTEFNNAPLIGCGSHEFNLAVKKWIGEQLGLEEASNQVNTLMTKANASALKVFTNSEPVWKTKTHWNSSFAMLCCHAQIKDSLESVPRLEEFLPTLVQKRMLADTVAHFEKFNAVTNLLQEKGVSMVEARRECLIPSSRNVKKCPWVLTLFKMGILNWQLKN